MIEKEKLRKADFFSGGAVVLVGLFIIYHGMQMPMKDSWGGVQNVWYVSPALFPLFVGAMLGLLGLSLMKTAVKAVRFAGILEVLSFIGSSRFMSYLREASTVRIYGVVVNLLVFVFLMIPRIDFFFSAIFFLLTLFFMYYCGDHAFLTRMLKILLGWGGLLLAFIVTGLPGRLSGLVSHPLDWLTALAILLLIFLTGKNSAADSEFKRKFRISLLVGLAAPFTVGIIFKFFLLVPLPYEGMIVQLLDLIWYADMWS